VAFSSCDQEPIHIPGAIQPHGALVAAIAASGVISHASANLAAIAGVPPPQALGAPLHTLIGHAVWLTLRGLEPGAPACTRRIEGADGQALHLSAHRSGDHLCVELEPALPPAPPSLPLLPTLPLLIVQPVLDSFRAANTQQDLCDRAVHGLRQMTGYDRVMAYRFIDDGHGHDGHGEVIAEARDETLPAYLGLRYPASDIPAQARRQYLRQPIGMIADSSYVPVPLVTAAGLDDGAPLDLTQARLRSVSPVHRHYMRNMGTAASLTVALVCEDNLWGMLVCHHATPRIAEPELRAAADLVGRVVSLLLAGLRSVETLAQRQSRTVALRSVVAGLSAATPLPEALAAIEPALLQVVGATGALVRLGSGLLGFGQVPPHPLDAHLLAVLNETAPDDLFALDDLCLHHPECAACAPQAAGALLARLTPGREDAILWLRPEQAMLFTWGGNPAEHATQEPASGHISPRTSFAAWRQEVRGRSRPWTDADRELAHEVAQALTLEIAQRTRAALEREQAASRAKSAYLAGMSHELRTPLNGILGYAQLLSSEGGLNPVQAGRVGAMMSAGTHLLHIIGRVLELAQIEADRPVFNPAAFDIRAVAAECLDLVRPMAAAKRLSLTLQTDAAVPQQMITDPTRFRQILLNLLGNAVKFTLAGGVALNLRIAADGESLRADVIDSGPGIDVAKRHRLFQAFQQLGPLDQAKGDGAGLGLAITARLVALLGGCLGHKENPAGGSIFWLELPLFDAVPMLLPATQAFTDTAPPQPAGPALAILVADDSSINRDIAGAFLRAAGHRVTFAEDGMEAVAAAAAADFDVILMDVRMPRLSGIEATRRIRAIPGRRGRVPVIALTAQVFADQIDECRKAEMNDHLAKPFTREDLLAAVTQAQGRPGALPASAQAWDHL
jgi:light-regulated signal transduction histidine kinase (bacteriophytochrome)/ActR/RegA family two-component response regulator